MGDFFHYIHDNEHRIVSINIINWHTDISERPCIKRWYSDSVEKPNKLHICHIGIFLSRLICSISCPSVISCPIIKIKPPMES